MRFEGTSAYVATDDLKIAVNAAITLERPLLVKGEPGTGKTVLAVEIAKALGAPLIEWHVKSTTKALQGLYEYDAVSRLRDSQLGDERVKDIRNYIKRGKLWDAFVADERPVLLVRLHPGETATRQEFLDFLEGKIARWWMPDDVVFVDDIPLGATGKIDKKLIRERMRDYVLPTARESAAG